MTRSSWLPRLRGWDEIGELPLAIQAKLVRFLQERSFERVGGKQTLTVDTRIICATHRDLARAVADREFRQDLYFRVRVVEIVVPPLRERGRGDIEILTRHFADHYARRHGRPVPSLGPQVLEALAKHPWPGNVRELEHWVESAVVLGEKAELSRDLGAASAGVGPDVAFVAPRGLTLHDLETRYVNDTLELCEGNKTKASQVLGVGRNTVQRILER